MTYELDGNDLQKIRSEKHRIKSELEPVKYPFSPTKEVDIFDYQGVDRIINIRGTATFADLADMMNNFVTPLEILQNGSQDPVVYHSDLVDNATSGDYQDGNFYVKVESFDWDYTDGSTILVTYTLVLFEGQ